MPLFFVVAQTGFHRVLDQCTEPDRTVFLFNAHFYGGLVHRINPHSRLT